MGQCQIGNLFINAEPPASGERFETLLVRRNLVIERIVSSSDAVPTEYVQPQDEWVLLAQGSATLNVAGADVELKAGDYLYIPATVPHTVKHTSDGALWLAVHLHQTDAHSASS